VNIDFVNPSKMGFTNVVTVNANGVKTIYVSGQTGRGPDGIPDDLGEQADIAWAGVVAQLEAAGATVNDVIKTNTYIVDIDPDRVRKVGKPMMKYFPQENKPASTWVGVTGLVSPELKVEIEAIAVTEAD